jgi:hypothetical protein
MSVYDAGWWCLCLKRGSRQVCVRERVCMCECVSFCEHMCVKMHVCTLVLLR